METNGIGSATREAGALPAELQILELFNRPNVIVIGPSDVEKLTGINKATASPKMRTMAGHGYLIETSHGKYQLGPRMYEIFGRYMGQMAVTVTQMESMLIQRLRPMRDVFATLSSMFDQDAPSDDEIKQAANEAAGAVS